MPRETYFEAFYPRITPVQHAGVEPHDKTEITISYSRGGLSYFDGDTKPRGLRLSVWPVRVDGACTSRMLFDKSSQGFLLKEMGRRSDRLGRAMADALADAMPSIALLAETNDWAGIRDVVAKKIRDVK